MGGQGGHGPPLLEATMGGEDLVDQLTHICARPVPW
jgi:hypothetical protein